MHNGSDKMCDRIMAAYRDGYRKAIDDVVDEINQIGYVPVCVDCITKHQIIEIAERLKEGGVDAGSRIKDL